MSSPIPSEGGLDFQYATSDAREPPSRKEIIAAIIMVSLILLVCFYFIHRQSEQARTLNCAANMQQIGEAMLLYTQDNDETFPNRLTGWPTDAVTWQAQEAYTWRSAIRSYLKSGRSYICLSNPMNQTQTGCNADICGGAKSYDGFDVSYACNYVGGANPGDPSRGFCADKTKSHAALHPSQVRHK